MSYDLYHNICYYDVKLRYRFFLIFAQFLYRLDNTKFSYKMIGGGSCIVTKTNHFFTSDSFCYVFPQQAVSQRIQNT
jgi:hypothetical protein